MPRLQCHERLAALGVQCANDEVCRAAEARVNVAAHVACVGLVVKVDLQGGVDAGHLVLLRDVRGVVGGFCSHHSNVLVQVDPVIKILAARWYPTKSGKR